jgi:hypothetical protein
MATYEFALVDPPEDPRRRELWLQHAAGFIIFEDIRRRALDRLDHELDAATRAVASVAIDDAVYGLMEVADGFSGTLQGPAGRVDVRLMARFLRPNEERGVDEEVVVALDLGDGDGMGMGFAGWIEGDFGRDPLVVRRAPPTQ